MTTHERNPGGGVFDIPREADAAAPSGSPVTFEVGDVVSPNDRDNVGVVVGVNGQTIQVRCTSKRDGGTADRFFPAAALQLIRRAAAGRDFTPLNYRQLLSMPPAEWLIHNVLRLGELACLFGAPASMKTFIALDIALRVASGVSWFGSRVRPGPVLYIAAEGLYSVCERTKAWIVQFQDRDDAEASLEQHFEVLGDAPSFLEKEFETVLEMLRARRTQWSLIVVDTLARCMAGGDENSSQDMGLFVRACDRVREATGATVLVLHHAGKNDKRSERGSSALRGACDAMLLATVDESSRGMVDLSCAKQKEGEPFVTHRFRLELVRVGEDDFGVPRQSGYLVDEHWEPGKSPASPVPEADAMDVIQRTLTAACFRDGASATALRDTAVIARSTFYRHLSGLIEEGLVEILGSGRMKRYRLLPKSSHFKQADAAASVSSLSPTSLTQSHETPPESSAESQVSVSPPPLGGDVRRDETETAVADPHPESSPRRSKPSRRSKAGQRSNAKTQSKPATRSKPGPRATAVAKLESKERAAPATRSKSGKRPRNSTTAPDVERPPAIRRADAEPGDDSSAEPSEEWL